MAQYVVIALDPTVDTSRVVGPFRSLGRAEQASEALTLKGYNTETCECLSVGDVDAADWSDG